MPYKSKAQQRAMHAKADRGEISQKTVHEFDEATKGHFGDLPERVKKKHAHEKSAQLIYALQDYIPGARHLMKCASGPSSALYRLLKSADDSGSTNLANNVATPAVPAMPAAAPMLPPTQPTPTTAPTNFAATNRNMGDGGGNQSTTPA